MLSELRLDPSGSVVLPYSELDSAVVFAGTDFSVAIGRAARVADSSLV